MGLSEKDVWSVKLIKENQNPGHEIDLCHQ